MENAPKAKAIGAFPDNRPEFTLLSAIGSYLFEKRNVVV